jgi:hypothetical protein
MADELLKTPLHAVLRLAGVDLEAIARAVAALERALASDNPEHALRAADQVWRLLGAYSRTVTADRPKVPAVAFQVNPAAAAPEPAPPTRRS